MFCVKRIRDLPRTIAFKLTIWYAVIFAISSSIAFIVFYVMVIGSVHGQTDTYLLDKAEEMRSLLASEGLKALEGEINREARALGTKRVFFRLIGRDERILASSDISGWRRIGIDGGMLKMALAGKPAFKTTSMIESRQQHRRARILYIPLSDGMILQMGLSLRNEGKLLESFREVFTTAMLIVITMAGLGGWFLAHRALRRVADVTSVAREISKGSLKSRVPLTGTGDEIDRLASTFNEMLDHIQKLVSEMREITDNIAHDMRSPITRIRGSAEVALMQERRAEEYQETLAEIISECDRLLSLINVTLDISEAESGLMKLNMKRVDLSDIARRIAEMFRPVAEEKGLNLQVKAESEVYAMADPNRLLQAAANLVDNALKYTPPEGDITLSVDMEGDHAVLGVSDTGVGIPPEEISRIFRRFYRGDRSRSGAGFGLGLSIAQAIVHAHGGEIHVDSSPGEGSTFKILLKAAIPNNTSSG